MKIVRIIARLNVGGPARHVIWLTQRLQDDEFSSVLIAGSIPPGEEDMDYFASEHGVAPIYIAEMSRELSLKDIISLWKVYRELRRQHPDIIHTHTAKAGTVGRVAAFFYRWLTPGTFIGRPRRVKVIHTFHGHVFHSYYGRLKTGVFIAIERILARLVTDKIVVISAGQLREINEQYRIGNREQFAVVPLGLDLAAFTEVSIDRTTKIEALRADNTSMVVGFVGRLTEIKNVELLLETAAEYKARAEVNVPPLRFAIIGDGHLRPSLEKKAHELGISDIVYFLGNRVDAEELITTLNICILTSKNEGTPLSLIEAMAAGVPVISTYVGGVRDLLGAEEKRFDGFVLRERGVSVDSFDPKDLLNGLIYLAKNEKVRVKLADKSRVFANSAYTIDRLVNDMRVLYRNMH